MSTIAMALNDVRLKIPKEVLEATFIPAHHYGTFQLGVNIDSELRRKVIDGRVMVDCNLTGGTQTLIPLSLASYEYIDQYNLIVTIPKKLTNGRGIIFPLNLTLFNYNNQYSQTSVFGLSNQAPLLNAAKGVMNSHLPSPIVSTASVRLMAGTDNVVHVSGTGYTVGTSALLVMLENDAELNNIKPTSAHDFFKLVELATKAYIYNTLIIKMDSAAIQGGFSLGALKNAVESYSDAESMYQEYFQNTWRRVALMNDPESKMRHLKMIGGGNW